MVSIKINDLAQDANMSPDEMKRIKGGAILSSSRIKSSSFIYKTTDPFYVTPESLAIADDKLV